MNNRALVKVKPACKSSIRHMQFVDVSAITALEAQVQLTPWTEGIFIDCLLANYQCWVLSTNRVPKNESLEGFVIFSVAASECHLLNLAVHPLIQGQGYGRQLLQHTIKTAANLGANKIFLEVRVSNQRAIVLYKSFDFEQIGIRKNYYGPTPYQEDGLIFALTLN